MSRRITAAITSISTSRPGTPAASAISATCRCPRRWTTRIPSSASRPSSGTSPMPAPIRSRSAAITASPAASCRRSPARGRRLTDGRKAALLHLDAHTDAYENIDHWMGPRNRQRIGPLLRAPGQSRSDPQRPDRHARQSAHPQLAAALLRSRLRGDHHGPLPRDRRRRCIDIIREAHRRRPLYITFDLDCLDPSVAPGVSNIEAGVTGWSIDEANQLLRACAA